MKVPTGSFSSHAFIFLIMMVILEEVHFVVGGYQDLSVYGSQQLSRARDEDSEQSRPSWKWRNRNRGKSKRNRSKDSTKLRKRNPINLDDLIFPVEESIDSCCPTVYEMIEPVAGRNRSGHLVDLYQDERVRQRFYEVSCHRSILNKPCKFIESRHSQCVQTYALTYALVRPPGITDDENPWSLDYISIRSGCACQVVNFRRIKKLPEGVIY